MRSSNYNKCMLTGIISKLYNAQGNITIKAIIIGSKTVHEKDISWSNLILGKDALTHIKVNIIRLLLIPSIKPLIIPSVIGDSKLLLCMLNASFI